MKRFKQFLIEGSDTPVNDIIFGSSDADVIIPLSQSIWERLTGEKKDKYAVHITDREGLEQIRRISGSKKGIPSMTDASDKVIKSFVDTKYGVLTDGGVWVVLKGKPIIEMAMDYGTWRDTQGRRWIDITFKMDRFADLENNMVTGFRDLRERIYTEVIEAQDDNPELQKEMGSFDPEDPDRWRSDNIYNFNHIGGTNNRGTGKEKALALKMYIDGAEQLVRENLRDIQIMITTPSSMRFHADWDEIIMTKFKIARIVIEYRQYKHMTMDVDQMVRKYRAPVFIAGEIGSGNDEIVSVIKEQAFEYVRGRNDR
tara:strand:- start:6533 stop:7471 length:939 start_codon:yes stop_codon:yes gene_type:complete